MPAPDLTQRTTVFIAKIGTDDAGYNIVGAPQPRLTIATALADLASGYNAATPAAPKTIALEPGTYTTPAFALPPNVFIEADPDAMGGDNAEVIIQLTGNITLSSGWTANTAAVGGFRGVTIRQEAGAIDLTMPTPVAGNPVRTVTLENVRTDTPSLSWEATSTADVLNLITVVYDGLVGSALEFSGGTQVVDNLQSTAPILFNDTAAIAVSLNARGIYTVATPSAVAPGVTFASSTGGMLARMGMCDNRALTLNRAGAAALTVYADAVSIPLVANLTFSGTATQANLIRTTDSGGITPAGAGFVTSVAGTAGNVLVNGGTAAAAGAVTLSLPTALTGVNSLTSVAGQNLILATGTGGTAGTFNSTTKSLSLSSAEVATAVNTGALAGIGFGFSGTAGGASFVGGNFTAGGNLTVSGTGTSSFAGVTTIANGVTATPSLQAVNSAANAVPYVASFLAPSTITNSGVGNGPYISVGVAATLNNAAAVQFLYTGAGSANNAIQLGTFASTVPTTIDGSGNIVCRSKLTTLGGATFHTTSSALIDGAGGSLGTLATAPSAGNPTKWIGINDNGTVRYIPAW